MEGATKNVTTMDLGYRIVRVDQIFRLQDLIVSPLIYAAVQTADAVNSASSTGQGSFIAVAMLDILCNQTIYLVYLSQQQNQHRLHLPRAQQQAPKFQRLL